MPINDIINCSFEFIGAILCWKNAQKLYTDKVVAGVHWEVTAFFTIWGYWNLYYYPSLNQWLSFIAGVFLVTGNTAWVILAIYYLKFKKRG